MAETYEGYLRKHIGYTRTLERYYHWDGTKLSYWKRKEDKDKAKEAKDTLPGTDLERVMPDPEKNDRFTIQFKNKTLALKGEPEEIQKWLAIFQKWLSKTGEQKDDNQDEDTAHWTIDQIIEMMANGQVMSAYFSNNTKKNFKLYCKDLTLYACPVNGGIDKAIISLPLRRISDIYVGKQTPGFDTEVASAVPFDRCFTVISRKYTLDVEAKSYQMATHWLAGIKYLLTKSGKAVIVNEQEAGQETQSDEHAEGGQDNQESSGQQESVHDANQDASPGAGEQPSHEDQAAEAQKAEADAEAAVSAAMKISPEVQGDDFDLDLEEGKKSHSALLIIDIQNDFLPPSGALAVKDGLDVIPVINKLHKRVQWGMVALSQDWHPENHISFYVNNKDKPGAQLYKPLDLGDGKTQMMWPQHCVAESQGAAFHPELIVEDSDKIIKKGQNSEVDSYSAFCDNDGKSKTELEDLLKNAGITDVFVTGVAYDYCVGYSALDAKKAGFNVYVVDDASRGVAENTTRKMKETLHKEGISIITADTIPDSGVMPDEYEEVELEEEEEQMNIDEDSGPDNTKSPKQLNVDDFLSEDFLAGIDGADGKKDDKEDALDGKDAVPEQASDALKVAEAGEEGGPDEAKAAAPVAAKKPVAAGAAAGAAVSAAAATGAKTAGGAKPVTNPAGAKKPVPAAGARKPLTGPAAGARKPAGASLAVEKGNVRIHSSLGLRPAPRPLTRKPPAKVGQSPTKPGARKPVSGAPTARKPLTATPAARRPGAAPAAGARKPGSAAVTPAKKPLAGDAKRPAAGARTPAQVGSAAARKPVATPASATKRPVAGAAASERKTPASSAKAGASVAAAKTPAGVARPAAGGAAASAKKPVAATAKS